MLRKSIKKSFLFLVVMSSMNYILGGFIPDVISMLRMLRGSVRYPKKTVKIAMAVAAFIVISAIIVLLLMNDSAKISCQTDIDCAPLECCHPNSCINIAFKQTCNELCTQVCTGPLDCNKGSCICIEGRCSVVLK